MMQPDLSRLTSIDPLADNPGHWARHPRSRMHLSFIVDAASKHEKFAVALRELVEAGVCTSDYKPLFFYRNSVWCRA